jgi:hypothetical protein
MSDGPDGSLGQACAAIQAAAERQGVPLRLVGSYAVRTHCERLGHLLDLMARETANDLDFASERKVGKGVQHLFEALGYIADKRLALATDGQHRYFVHPESRLGVDVYFDLMNYCHPVPFANRLAADPVTVPLAELLMAKMQIVQLTEKDIKDTMVLLLEHDLGAGDEETVNIDRITEVLSHDWGFYYTFSQNLAKVAERLPLYEALDPEARATLDERLARLRERIEAHPKDLRWKLRSRVGTRRPWYQDVEEKT